MRFTASAALATLALASLSRAATVTLPSLYSCEPATIHVVAKGNYTIEGRDFDSHKLVFRAHIAKGISNVTWDAVDLPSNATAVISVTEQLRSNNTSLATASGPILASPSGNTTCLATSKKGSNRSSAKQKNMVPTIIGIALGAFFVLVLLLVGGMMYRRKKEKSQKIEEDDVDLNQAYSNAPGSNYMARLVPGLKLQEARPLPRDPVLESEQANYASTRRGTHYYNTANSPDLAAHGGARQQSGYDLPSYRQSQRLSKFYADKGAAGADSAFRGDGRIEQQSQTGYGAAQWPQQQPYSQQHQQAQGANPFASQSDLQGQAYQPSSQHLQQQQYLYEQKDWGHSQSSFLDRKESR